MKIDANRPGVETTGQLKSDRVNAESARKPGASVPQPAGDRVSLSAMAELANAAVKAAADAPEIRTDLVERMRALRAAGQLGADAERLADAMIQHMVSRDDKP